VTDEGHADAPVALRTIAREWTRLGVIGFGGPPAHIALLRRMCVEERSWMDAEEFEDGVAATNLLPGPASTQLAIYCAWKLRGAPGALLGGLCFIAPGLALIMALATVFLSHHPPTWILGAAAGAGAAVPAVALRAASRLVAPSWLRVGEERAQRLRWVAYALIGAVSAAVLGAYLVVALVACGLAEVALRSRGTLSPRAMVGGAGVHALGLGGVGALSWVALKVGALSYGGGFVIVPLMQHDVVSTYHWMSGTQFLSAVALGQVTPGPVVQTIAVVGYAAGGFAGALLASLVAFGPSFLFVLFGAPLFSKARSNRTATSFLLGAGPTVIGAIAGSAVPLGLSLHLWWQVPVLGAALVWCLLARRGVVSVLLAGAALGILLAILGVGV
jgi:chromate transporter